MCRPHKNEGGSGRDKRNEGLWKQAQGDTPEKFNIKRNHAAIKHFPCSLTIGETSNVNTTQQHNCYIKTYGQGRLCLISDCAIPHKLG